MKTITVDARMLESSGIGTVIRNILKRIIPCMPDITFYLLGRPEIIKNYPWLMDANVRCVPCKSAIYTISEQLELAWKIPKDTDLLWVPHYNIPVFYSGKMLVTVHDVFHLAMPQFVDGALKKFYAKIMFQAVAARATHVICVSHFTASELQHFTGISSDKVSVIYNGVDEFWNTSLQQKQRIFIKPYILYAGNVKPHKNLNTLVRAFLDVMDRIPHSLVIVGKRDGFLTGDAEVGQLVKQAGNRISFTGFVSDEELKNYYHYADLFVFPSLYEGFGLPPLEAMASGCREVLCSDIPVLREIYGNSVEYFRATDEQELASKIICKVTEHSGTFGKNCCNSYEWNTASVKYLSIFKQLLRYKL